MDSACICELGCAGGRREPVSPLVRRSEAVRELGAPPVWFVNPNSCLGRSVFENRARICKDGTWTENRTRDFVGIDVAKERLDVFLRPSGEAFVVPRDDKGLAELVERLDRYDIALVVLEATGGLQLRAAAVLAEAGLPVAVVNPRQVRDFARAIGRLAKTDRLDAEAIARFAEALRPVPRPLADAEQQRLAALVARRRQLIEMRVAEKNRRQRLGQPQLRRRLDEHLAWLAKAIAEIDQDLDGAVRDSSLWRVEDVSLLSRLCEGICKHWC